MAGVSSASCWRQCAAIRRGGALGGRRRHRPSRPNRQPGKRVQQRRGPAHRVSPEGKQAGERWREHRHPTLTEKGGCATRQRRGLQHKVPMRRAEPSARDASRAGRRKNSVAAMLPVSRAKPVAPPETPPPRPGGWQCERQ